MKTIIVFLACLAATSCELAAQLLAVSGQYAIVGYVSNLRRLDLVYTNAYCTQNQLWYYQKAWSAGMADDGSSTLISAISTNRVWSAGGLWDDLTVDSSNVKLGASAPDFDAAPAGGLLLYSFAGGAATDEQVYFTAQLPHSYDQNDRTEFYPHIHWGRKEAPSDAANSNVVWGLEWAWCNPNAAPLLSRTHYITNGIPGTNYFQVMSTFFTNGVSTWSSAAVSSVGSNYTSIPTIDVTETTGLATNEPTCTASLRLLAATIADGGTGYTNGNVLTVVGGTGTAATLIVTGVDTNGGLNIITNIIMGAGGSYSVLPATPNAVTGGAGTGASINLTSYGLSAVTVVGTGEWYAPEYTTMTVTGGGGTGAAAVPIYNATPMVKIGSIFIGRLFRMDTHAADTYDKDAVFYGFGIHYKKDGLGSYSPTSKY